MKKQPFLTLIANLLIIDVASDATSNATQALLLALVSDGSLGAHFVACASEHVLCRLILQTCLAPRDLPSASLAWRLTWKTNAVYGGETVWTKCDTLVLIKRLRWEVELAPLLSIEIFVGSCLAYAQTVGSKTC
jgi:hypothetical protein